MKHLNKILIVFSIGLFIISNAFCQDAESENQLSIVESTDGFNYLVLNSPQGEIDSLCAFSHSVRLIDYKIISEDLVCFLTAKGRGTRVSYRKMKKDHQNDMWRTVLTEGWVHTDRSPLIYRIESEDVVQKKSSDNTWETKNLKS